MKVICSQDRYRGQEVRFSGIRGFEEVTKAHKIVIGAISPYLEGFRETLEEVTKAQKIVMGTRSSFLRFSRVSWLGVDHFKL